MQRFKIKSQKKRNRQQMHSQRKKIVESSVQKSNHAKHKNASGIVGFRMSYLTTSNAHIRVIYRIHWKKIGYTFWMTLDAQHSLDHLSFVNNWFNQFIISIFRGFIFLYWSSILFLFSRTVGYSFTIYTTINIVLWIVDLLVFCIPVYETVKMYEILTIFKIE